MTAEFIIYMVIILICAALMAGIGFSQYKSKTPVGFWTGKKPPQKEQVSDVAAYNKKHGIMWLLYGVGLIASSLTVLTGNDTLAVIIIMGAVLGGLLLMIAYHNKLDRTYLIPGQK